ncbi:rRNA maturation RNase YbeY [Robiginitalea aurantiaca]|uniref:Endoribonuclease YbeY n=1 Tax=Robiginitalea aurantiaca TaxID=3056915 RepID=A0ABT7WAD1_9FLAO|nr:rRNA maturation RNase YbeY [Robiginitalea aurantiaca]MDM9629876.1 rRNA maturation RNase YbeY [Robiginitalea aurantiaca]
MGEIAYHYQTTFKLKNEQRHTDWIINVLTKQGAEAGVLNVIFTSDQELLKLNKLYLDHDYFTDIITFEYEEIPGLSGDLFISIDRVRENAEQAKATLEDEVRRVIAHGLFHLMGHNDKTESDIVRMRSLESEAIEMFHVKHLDDV